MAKKSSKKTSRKAVAGKFTIGERGSLLRAHTSLGHALAELKAVIAKLPRGVVKRRLTAKRRRIIEVRGTLGVKSAYPKRKTSRKKSSKKKTSRRASRKSSRRKASRRKTSRR